MGHFAHHRHGYLLHFVIDRFLCRQREKSTALERASTYCLLALARYGGNTADRLGIETLCEVVAFGCDSQIIAGECLTTLSVEIHDRTVRCGAEVIAESRVRQRESGRIAELGIEGGELMAMFEIAMIGNLPYTVLKDGIFAHPTLAESLNNLFKALAE